MKKIIALFLVLPLILAMAVPAYAVTPPLDTPASPTVPDIEVDLDLPASVFEGYIPDIEIPAATEAPTEPPEETDTCASNWHDWLRGWYRWWSNLIC